MAKSKLFNALFKEGTLALNLLQEIAPHHANGAVLLELNGYRDLDDIPWEYAWSGRGYLVCERMFTYMLEGEERQLPKLPLCIVIVAPDPMGSDKLGLANLHLSDQFLNFINEFYNSSKMVILERVLPATINKMNSLLAEKNNEVATVLHFMGHCTMTDDDSRALVFEHSKHGKPDIVKMPCLISTLENLWLAFLSACNTREIARDIAQQGVQYTIGSYCSLPDDIARDFEAQFYRNLAQGQSVDKAMWKTRMELVESADSEDFWQRNYLVGALILYSNMPQMANSLFLCKSGNPIIKLNKYPNNLETISTMQTFFRLHG
ncbi:CHAT domain-containing protein [Endogone sp. FLAS-F59071]|nr:CHAT domain-containing protein [Endogone sp. FLAS-F59071]|eukprot:RUS21202.1 CHAT domain-containing protein [Endogone sp. FLAS-F59071]